MTVSCQLTPFEVGQVKAHMLHGWGAGKIAEAVKRADGESFGETAILNCMRKLREDPGWRGERQQGSGAPRKTSAKMDSAIVKWVLKHRGGKKVTVSALKKHFPSLRAFNDTLVQERLAEADLVWLRRRKKCLVPKCHLKARIRYCEGVKRKHQSTLMKTAFTDGTVYYLDRDDAEAENSKRRALGTHVWRRSDNSDALWQECLGPSSYSKGQGAPCRVWGVLAHGVLYIHILEPGEVLNGQLYAEIIDDYFGKWCKDCEYLICDYEACLRSEEALVALEEAGLTLVEDYPPCSQDFNGIENAWALVRQRLDDTMPVSLESRTNLA